MIKIIQHFSLHFRSKYSTYYYPTAGRLATVHTHYIAAIQGTYTKDPLNQVPMLPPRLERGIYVTVHS